MKLQFALLFTTFAFASPVDSKDLIEEGLPTVLSGGGLLPFTAADFIGHAIAYREECHSVLSESLCKKNYKCFWEDKECAARKSFLSVMSGYETVRCLPQSDETSCLKNNGCKWSDNVCHLDFLRYLSA